MKIEDMSLPHNIQAETAIISGMMQSEAVFFEALGRLKEECFYDSSMRACFKHFVDSKNRDHILIDKLLLKVSEGRLSAAELYLEAYSTTGKTEIEIILDAYRRREGIRACQTALNDYYIDEDKSAIQTTSELIARASTLSVESEDRLVRLGDMVPEAIGRHGKILQGGKGAACIKTGFVAVDEMVSVLKHHYIILGARPSNGKSTFASTIGRHAAKEGKNVLVFYLDTSREAEIDRAIFAEAELNLMQFNLGSMPRRDITVLQFGYGKVESLPYYIDDTPSITPIQIRAKAQRLKAKLGSLDLIIVDFLQNVNAGIRGEQREKINYISQQLHELPKIVGCPVIALSQLARYQNEEKEPPTINLLKESGNLEADADVVMMLWYQEKYFKTAENKNRLNVYVCKNKDGQCGSTELNFFANIGKITDRSERNEKSYQDQW